MRLRRPALLLALPLLAACADSPSGPPAELTRLPRELTTQERLVVEASTTFAFGFLKTVADSSRGENVFVSPLSASMALGMAAAGAAGTTRNEMIATLGFGTAPTEAVNASYRSLIALLRSLDGSVDFRLANSLWYDRTFPFSASYLASTRAAFDATVEPVAFDAATKARIDQWVQAATNGRITAMSGDLDPRTVMLLLNAIYFKGRWRDAFDPRDTRDGPFTTAAGTTQTVKMMSMEKSLPAFYAPTYAAVELPYGASAFVMDVLVPYPGHTVDELVASLSSAEWARLTSGLQGRSAGVTVPRFTLENDLPLNGVLRAMGMRQPFVEGADFSMMSPERGHALVITKVRQKTFVEVNEEGTEAAAATSVQIGPTALPTRVVADRPFVFAIRERLSGTILFLGRINRIP